jgi:fumarylacetoacetate (FAA) hydrolase
VSNRGPDGGPGKPISEGGAGYACLAEVRTVETLTGGAPVTPFLKAGDTVRIEMVDSKRASIFGAIEQVVAGS